jgi:hypothetical protein
MGISLFHDAGWLDLFTEFVEDKTFGKILNRNAYN